MPRRPLVFIDSQRDGFQASENVSPQGANAMMGNVWEWCSDWSDVGLFSISPESNPTGPESGSSKVLRVGGWEDSDYYHRAANRNGSFPENRNPFQGFRCVREG